MEERRCQGIRRDSTPCQAPANTVGANGYCWAHDPTNAAARREAQARGGRNKRTAIRADKLVPGVLRPVLDILLASVDEVKDGRLTTQQASALASLAGAIVKVYQAGTLEERIQALEALHAQQEARTA